MATSASSQSFLGAPSMERISSPGSSGALAAGEPGWTAPITGRSRSTASTPYPIMKSAVKAAMARMPLNTGPAT